MRSLFYCSTRLNLAVGLLVICGITSLNTQAQQKTPRHDGWYKVEMIIFARTDYQGMEQWPTNIQLSYPADWISFDNPAQATSQEADANTGRNIPSPNDLASRTQNSPSSIDRAIYLLPDSEKELSSQALRFQRSSRYKLLFHNAWRQFITNKQNSKAILMRAGQTYDQHHELEGSIRISVATYLQLETNLWFTQFIPNVGQEVLGQEIVGQGITSQWPQLPTPPDLIATQPSEAYRQNINAMSINQMGFGQERFVPNRIVLVQEGRDMRSKEIHYVDHPLIGIIVKIVPTGLQ